MGNDAHKKAWHDTGMATSSQHQVFCDINWATDGKFDAKWGLSLQRLGIHTDTDRAKQDPSEGG
jgi:hypothetical protein